MSWAGACGQTAWGCGVSPSCLLPPPFPGRTQTGQCLSQEGCALSHFVFLIISRFIFTQIHKAGMISNIPI